MPPTERLSPGRVAASLFGLAPDRDERAPQLCQEALLTLALNGYSAPHEDALRPPKLERFALRSLTLGENFLAGRDEGRAGAEMTPQRYGEMLAAGAELRGSANLGLARKALQGLVDPDTRKGQPGGWLLFPFHESLLWYDARRQGSGGRWGVRRVWMRGGGITLARLLADPPAGSKAAALGATAVAALRQTLQARSPLADIASRLERPLGDGAEPERAEQAERNAWQLGGEERMSDLADRVCRHAEGVMLQGGASGPARLWQLRAVLALDVALHALRTAWGATDAPEGQRFLLLSFDGPPRAENRVRQLSEDILQRARIRVQEAILAALAHGMEELATDPNVDWQGEFLSRRDKLSEPIARLREGDDDYDSIAREVVSEGDYGRPVGGFMGLLQTAGLVASTGQYRYLSASAELLPALVGALSARMPMSSDDFFEALFGEWGFVVGQRAAARTHLAGEIDGADLERNARRAEQRLSESGLALALSDRTTVVGERAQRTS